MYLSWDRNTCKYNSDLHDNGIRKNEEGIIEGGFFFLQIFIYWRLFNKSSGSAIRVISKEEEWADWS